MPQLAIKLGALSSALGPAQASLHPNSVPCELQGFLPGAASPHGDSNHSKMLMGPGEIRAAPQGFREVLGIPSLVCAPPLRVSLLLISLGPEEEAGL